MLSVSCDGLGCPVPVRAGGFGDPYGYGRGLGDGDGVTSANANVKALQAALVAAGATAWGTPVTATGIMSDQTIGALWNVIGNDLANARTKAASISSAAADAVEVLVAPMQVINGIVGEIPGVSTAKVLNNWSTIDSLLGLIPGCDACGSAATKLAQLRITVFQDIAGHASTLTSVINLLKKVAGTPVKPKPKYGTVSTATLNLLKTGALARQYPAGSVQRYNTSRKIWVVYKPRGSGFGAATPLVPAAGYTAPTPPTNTVIASTSSTQVPGVPVATPGTEADVPPFYKRWWFWTGLAVVGAGGGYYYYRTKHAGAAK